MDSQYRSLLKIKQEVRDKVALNKLIENQTSEREKARLLSFSLPQLEAWLSAAKIPALDLHLLPNDFHAAVKYRLSAPIYEKERKCPYCITGSLNTLGDHAVACHGRGDISLRHDRLRDEIFFQLQRCQPVTNSRTEKPDNRNKFSTWRCVFTLSVFWATGSSGC